MGFRPFIDGHPPWAYTRLMSERKQQEEETARANLRQDRNQSQERPDEMWMTANKDLLHLDG